MDCLFECIKIARERGEPQVDFAAVDLMIVEKSRKIVEYKLEN